MGKVIENPKGFKVIHCRITEIRELGCVAPVCDYCNSGTLEGYYIAVLNCWYCPECYEKWMARAVRYEEDSHIEERNFTSAAMRMNIEQA